MYDPLGLSIGTTNLVAACNGNPPVTRRAVLTQYPHSASKVGLLEEDPNLTTPGILVSGFVERIGDAVALLAPDGSAHDPSLLMVEALDAMVIAAGADASLSEIAIALPVQWKPQRVQALRNGLRTHMGFVRSGMAPRLIPDAIAALTAVDAELSIPTDGVVGLLDFGASGTSITLVETRSDLQQVSATLRCEVFSGNEIDEALLLRVLDEIGSDVNVDPASTTAVGELSHLRELCRAGKERLSVDTVTELAAGFSGCGSSIQVTREQLDDLMQDRLASVICAFDDMLARNNTSFADLAAVVAVGGGASIPLVVQHLSAHACRQILMTSQPAFSAAAGALLLASRTDEPELRTRASATIATTVASGSVIELPRGHKTVIDQDALTDRELAWSQTEYPGDVSAQLEGDSYNEDGPCWSMRLNVIEPPKEPPWRRVRVSQLLIGLCAVVAMTAIGGVAITLTTIERRQDSPPISITPSIVPVPAPLKSTEHSSLAPSSVLTKTPLTGAEPTPTSAAPPPPVITTTKVRPTTTVPPTTTRSSIPTTTTSSSTTTTTTPPTTTTEPPTTTTTTSTVQMTTQWLHVPLIPIPIPVPVPVLTNRAPQTQSPQNPFLVPDMP